MNRRTCHFSGRVQGVGFRYTTESIARNFHVQGYVRNLSDGRVELVMEGADDQLAGLLDAIKQRMEGFIKNVNVQNSPATGEFEEFSVRH